MDSCFNIDKIIKIKKLIEKEFGSLITISRILNLQKEIKLYNYDWFLNDGLKIPFSPIMKISNMIFLEAKILGFFTNINSRILV